MEDLTQYVDKYYMMNPETDDVLFDGTLLRNGMVVLIESPSKRAYTEESTTAELPSNIDLRFLANQWCMVTEVQTEMYGDKEYVAFIGLYPNNVKRKRVEVVQSAWLVKINTIPED